jgi:hypothetical protein
MELYTAFEAVYEVQPCYCSLNVLRQIQYQRSHGQGDASALQAAEKRCNFGKLGTKIAYWDYNTSQAVSVGAGGVTDEESVGISVGGPNKTMKNSFLCPAVYGTRHIRSRRVGCFSQVQQLVANHVTGYFGQTLGDQSPAQPPAQSPELGGLMDLTMPIEYNQAVVEFLRNHSWVDQGTKYIDVRIPFFNVNR